jgi:hypothetical protein
MHWAELWHDTLSRKLSAPLPGLGVTDHELPFHDSTRVTNVDPLESEPTAVQLVALTHDTPVSALYALPGSGLVMTDQVVPFQVSIKVSVTAPLA